VDPGTTSPERPEHKQSTYSPRTNVAAWCHTQQVSRKVFFTTGADGKIDLSRAKRAERYRAATNLDSGQTSFDGFYCDPEILATIDEAASVVQ